MKNNSLDPNTIPGHSRGSTKRISFVPIIGVGIVLLIVIGILFTNIFTSSHRNGQIEQETSRKSIETSKHVEKLIEHVGNGIIPTLEETPTEISDEPDPIQYEEVIMPLSVEETIPDRTDNRIRDRFNAMIEMALNEDTAIQIQHSQPAANHSVKTFDKVQQARSQAIENLHTTLDHVRARNNGDNHEKTNLTSQGSQETYYSYAQRTPPRSPFELKTGTVLPAMLDHGIHSDLPGQIEAHISQDVYDTATGQFLLIPQGTRTLGTYDHNLVFGQERLLVSWNRLIFPDGSTMNLVNMPGVDQMGYSGFKDKVNHHYKRIFGSALLLSIFSGGIQLSQPETDEHNRNITQETLSAALGQQLGQVATEILKKNINIQPTIEIRPGLRFHIVLIKDINFSEPYTHYDHF